MTVWLVQYRYEKEREFDERLARGRRETWRINPYSPKRIAREAREDDLVVVWRAVDRVTPFHRPRDKGGIVGWGRLRLEGRDGTQPTLDFDIEDAFPTRPIPRSEVLTRLREGGFFGIQWPGIMSLRQLSNDQGRIVLSLLSESRAINAPPPLANGIAPDWASGWGEDEHGVFVEITVDEVTQALRWCPPGHFKMGSPKDEGPQVDVTFQQGFWMFETPVTQALYKAVTGKTPSRFEGPDRPVEKVSWHDARTFLDAINERIPGLDLCLPSETQWEYACRAGSNTPFEPNVARTHTGASITPEEVNYDSDRPYAKAAKGKYRQETLPVKPRGFRPSAWGLWQMHGNVWEWCADVWHRSHEGASPAGLPRPASQPNEMRRVVRGGSWRGRARDCQAAFRDRFEPDNRYDALGFRPARGQASGAQAAAAEPQGLSAREVAR